MDPIEKVLSIARAEIGYLEKSGSSQLDSKTANAGKKNWTKYARDLDALKVYDGPKNGYPWCAVFDFWCLVRAFGLETALEMTGQRLGGYGAGCTALAGYYRAAGRFRKSAPQPGDQIFFTKDDGKTFFHTGLVERVEAGKVYTIEGNTSSAAGVVDNGGAVRDKSYSLTYNKIGGYGRPDYSLVKEEDEMVYYKTLNDVPAGYQPTIRKLIEKGALKGYSDPDPGRVDDNVLNISEDMSRVLTVLDKLGKLD